jgi:hypothetical protein
MTKNNQQCLDPSAKSHGSLNHKHSDNQEQCNDGSAGLSVTDTSIHTADMSATSGCVSMFSGGTHTELTLDSTIRQGQPQKLSLLGKVVRKCACELQSNPPVGERRCQLILQSLLNILNNHTMETTSNAMHYHNNDKSKKQHATSIAKAKKAAVDYGALPAITHVMKTYKDSATLQSRAILILGGIGEDRPEYQEAIADVHGVSFIMAVLLNASHAKSNTLCLEVCSSLVKICSNSHRNVSQLTHGDGIRILRSVMGAHSKQAGFQHCALVLLSEVAYQPSPPNERNIILMNQNDTYNPYQFLPSLEDPELIELLVDTMTRHKKVKQVLQKGGHLIYLLATQGSPRTKNSLVWSKAVPITLKVLKTFQDSPVTQLEGLEAMWSLAMSRPESRDVLAEEGCFLLMESMALFPKKRHIQDTACKILRLLCQDHAHSAHVAKCLKKNPEFRNTLRDTKQKFPDECDNCVVAIIQCYNQIYEQKE